MLDATGKVELLRSLAVGRGYRVGVETGIYEGSGSLLQLHPEPLEVLYVLDLQVENVRRAKAAKPSATMVLGDSAWTIEAVCGRIASPALFWLDAHLIENDGELVELFPCPLLDELEAIMAHGLYWGSTVLIDDLRLCNGSFGWPRLDEVRSLVDECWLREEADDIMLLTPR